MVGGLIMAHGDDAGLRLPPRLAPTQAVVLLVRAEDGAGEAAATLVTELRAAGVRTELDERTEIGFGRRAVDWELKGVPVRIEVGPRDLAKGEVTVVRRDVSAKSSVGVGAVAGLVPGLLEEIQHEMLATATAARDARITDVDSVEAAAEAAAEGFARVPWPALVASDGEAVLRRDGITVRCLIEPDGSLPSSEDGRETLAIVARAY
jgi:prolyl-tRNA synthetase